MQEQEQFTEIALESGTYESRVTKKFTLRKPFEKVDPRVIKASIPGVIDKIETRVGAKVTQGEALMILEAMKMLNRIKAPVNGTVKVIRVAPGEKVTKGQVLLEIE
ncbi:MAG: acetyl-CoA carboxylase biotin carboxyl carrier protein subunit [Propionivibrio sp.]